VSRQVLDVRADELQPGDWLPGMQETVERAPVPAMDYRPGWVELFLVDHLRRSNGGGSLVQGSTVYRVWRKVEEGGERMSRLALEGAIALYLFRWLHSPRSRDIHAAIAGDQQVTLGEVRSALQRMKQDGKVRTAGHYGWKLTDPERERIAQAERKSEREAWRHFDEAPHRAQRERR
jgi:hypothetical protein